MSFTNQKFPKGKEYWGVKDRLKETEGDTDRQRERGGGGGAKQKVWRGGEGGGGKRGGEEGGGGKRKRGGGGGGGGGQTQRHRQPEREGKGRELYLRRRLLRSTGGP